LFHVGLKFFFAFPRPVDFIPYKKKDRDYSSLPRRAWVFINQNKILKLAIELKQFYSMHA
jgi:hypothetical protein